MRREQSVREGDKEYPIRQVAAACERGLGKSLWRRGKHGEHFCGGGTV